jgi:hypothetical protein
MEHADATPVFNSHESATSARKVRSEKIRIEQHSATGLFWIAGWLFSIGFLHLSFWKGVLALLIWPYYIGVSVAAALAR